MGQEITTEGRFQIYGHRGSPKEAPENTLASFEAALRAGADGFETDLRILSDGNAVLFHDDELRESDFESLNAGDCAACGITIERLSDLARFADRATMILEVKRAGWEEALLRQIGSWPDIVVASFDHSVLTRLRALGAAIAVGITFHGVIVDVAGYAARLGATWCFPNHRFIDRATVDSLHDQGISVVPWTANRRGDWDRLRAIGCDGVITDHPAQAVRWRAERP
jgi:glycerophosphoryl diester phosphodiesterase